MDRAYSASPSQELRDAWECWRILANKLLKEPYGVDLDTVGRQWANMYFTSERSLRKAWVIAHLCKLHTQSVGVDC